MDGISASISDKSLGIWGQSHPAEVSHRRQNRPRVLHAGGQEDGSLHKLPQITRDGGAAVSYEQDRTMAGTMMDSSLAKVLDHFRCLPPCSVAWDGD